jgi:hypothetical protein
VNDRKILAALFSFTALQTTGALPLGGGSIFWFCMDDTRSPDACPQVVDVLSTAGCASDGSSCILDVEVNDGTSPSPVLLSSHTAFLASPAAVLAALKNAPQPELTATVGAFLPDGSLPVTLAYAGGNSVSAVGLPMLVTLTSTFAGRFSSNSFTPLALPATVTFLPWGPTPDRQLFAATLRIQHIGQYA